jgi:hypothetical protein
MADRQPELLSKQPHKQQQNKKKNEKPGSEPTLSGCGANSTDLNQFTGNPRLRKEN